MIIRKRVKALIISLASLIVISIIGYFTLHTILNKPLLQAGKKEVSLYIDRDDTIDSVYSKLGQAIGLPIPMAFAKLVDYKKYATNIKIGKYKITSKDTPYTFFNKLSRGHQAPTRLVFNNIRTLEQLAKRLDPQLMIDSLEIITTLKDSLFLAKYNYTPQTVPAIFIPNTYEVYWTTSSEGLVERFIKEHKRFWNTERREKAQSIGLTPLEVAIIASIVEEETNIADEKPVVAGLYINRLKRNILLQADPTVKFALQDFSLKRILNKDTRVDSPYNTYKYLGLPPGPIRLPSQQGLNSVLNYTRHNFLYMCAKEDFSGRHNFSTNLSEHLANSRKYWRALNQRKIYR